MLDHTVSQIPQAGVIEPPDQPTSIDRWTCSSTRPRSSPSSSRSCSRSSTDSHIRRARRRAPRPPLRCRWPGPRGRARAGTGGADRRAAAPVDRPRRALDRRSRRHGRRGRTRSTARRAPGGRADPGGSHAVSRPHPPRPPGDGTAGGSDGGDRDPVRRALDIVAGHGWVVTIHDGPLEALDRLDATTEGETRFGAMNAAGLMAAIVDEVIAGYFSLVEGIEREIDALDEHALRRRPRNDVLARIVALRRRIGLIRRTLAPHRVAFAALAPAGDGAARGAGAAVARPDRPPGTGHRSRREPARPVARHVRHPHGPGGPGRQRRDEGPHPAVGRPAAVRGPGRDHGDELQAAVLRRGQQLLAGRRGDGHLWASRWSSRRAGGAGSRPRPYSSSSARANPNSAPPPSRGSAQIRPPIAAISRAHTNRPIPAPPAEPAVPGER